MERIEDCCFCNSGIEEVTLPSTLEEVGEDAFKDCKRLKVVWLEEGCGVYVKRYVGSSVEVRQK